MLTIGALKASPPDATPVQAVAIHALDVLRMVLMAMLAGNCVLPKMTPALMRSCHAHQRQIPATSTWIALLEVASLAMWYQNLLFLIQALSMI
jgi:hypothetical protein